MRSGCLFDPDPLGICEEILPRRHLRVAILPADEVNEFLPVWFTTLACKYNIETVTPHNQHALPADAVVKVLFIPCVKHQRMIELLGTTLQEIGGSPHEVRIQAPRSIWAEKRETNGCRPGLILLRTTGSEAA